MQNEMRTAPYAAAAVHSDAGPSVTSPAIATTNSAIADSIVSDFGDEFDGEAELVDLLLADALFEYELEELAV